MTQTDSDSVTGSRRSTRRRYGRCWTTGRVRDCVSAGWPSHCRPNATGSRCAGDLAGQGVERIRGTTWGDFAVVGTWDGRCSPSRRPSIRRRSGPRPARSTSPTCQFTAEPAGGWQAPDPARVTYEDQNRVFAAAEGLPGYADWWLDDGAERALRKLWGGSLCVSDAKHTQAELLKVQYQLTKLPGFLVSGPYRDQVQVSVVFDDGTLQRDLDKKYGAGLVVVSSGVAAISPVKVVVDPDPAVRRFYPLEVRASSKVAHFQRIGSAPNHLFGLRCRPNQKE